MCLHMYQSLNGLLRTQTTVSSSIRLIYLCISYFLEWSLKSFIVIIFLLDVLNPRMRMPRRWQCVHVRTRWRWRKPKHDTSGGNKYPLTKKKYIRKMNQKWEWGGRITEKKEREIIKKVNEQERRKGRIKRRKKGKRNKRERKE